MATNTIDILNEKINSILDGLVGSATSLWSDPTNFGSNVLNTVNKTTIGAFTQNITDGKTWNWNFSDNSLAEFWLNFGKSAADRYAEISKGYSIDTSSIGGILSSIGADVLYTLLAVPEYLLHTVGTAGSAIIAGVGQAIGVTGSSQTIDMLTNILINAETAYNTFFQQSVNISQNLGDTLRGVIDSVSGGDGGNSTLISTLMSGLSIFIDGTMQPYNDGVAETSFGYLMENSWSKTANSFLNTFASGSSSYSVTINTSTPFDPGENQNNLYGTMMLGAPPIFDHITDPKNRSIINTFLRDGKFLSLTPGYPKYNGSNYLLKTNDDAYHQTQNGESMLTYLLKNGIDTAFAEKDRRYYTFKSDYEDYYAYLETMLNTIWIKMGLGTEDNSNFNIFSFFDVFDNTGKINPNGSTKLLDRYRTSFGFFVNPEGTTTESINSSMTSFGATNSSQVNSMSDNFQNILYITGMGDGGAARNAARNLINIGMIKDELVSFAKETASNTLNNLSTMWSSLSSGNAGSAAGAAIKLPFSIAADTTAFLQKDSGAILQQFATSNGMKVVYPELWSDSNFSKTFNVNFEFISPYGDPLSIFKYVMAPFAALACFAMPRQAADNGYVSPFFVRADIPGLISMDLGLITDFTWTRGGNQNLWTKDGLPRAISGSFTIADLYPFLAMTKRFSFLSANPNYTVFLDNLAGFHAVYDETTDTGLNDYWKRMLNRISGDLTTPTLWNRYSSAERNAHKTIANTPLTNRLKLQNGYIKWIRKGD